MTMLHILGIIFLVIISLNVLNAVLDCLTD